MVVGPDSKVEQRRIETGQAYAGELAPPGPESAGDRAEER